MLNETSLDTLCAALTQVMGIDAPAQAAQPCGALTEYVLGRFGKKTVDRVFLYHPDAIGQWISEKYPQLLKEVLAGTDFAQPFQTVMPSVTPVCFGTMYTGAQPDVHGIRCYEKPVITIDTLFDALIRAGKKPVIIADEGSSLSRIYLNREMDYFFYKTAAEINAKAAELILRDTYDFIVVYNGNYDEVMHKFGPESMEALSELRANSASFGLFRSLIAAHWTQHRTLLGFAMDHGCHEIDGGCGSHGLAMPEDLNIVHRYQCLPY